MAITIDAAGGIVIPKALIDAAGIRPGMPLEVRLSDGRIEIEPAPPKIELRDKQGIKVAASLEGVAALTSADVERTINTFRAERT